MKTLAKLVIGVFAVMVWSAPLVAQAQTLRVWDPEKWDFVEVDQGALARVVARATAFTQVIR